MKPIPYKRHRFPPDTIRLAVWLYFRFTTSLRDVEEMLAEVHRRFKAPADSTRGAGGAQKPPLQETARSSRRRGSQVGLRPRVEGMNFLEMRGIDTVGDAYRFAGALDPATTFR